MPIALAALTLSGLAIALVDEAQPWRAIAWVMLSAPLVIALLAWSSRWPPSFRR